MHVLADALADAGCSDEALLGHLRGGGPHSLGCWAIELLSGGRPGATAAPEGRELPQIARPIAAWSVPLAAPDSLARPPLEPADLAHRLDTPVEGGREAILAAAWSPESRAASEELPSIRRVWLFVADDSLPLPKKYRGRPLATPAGTMLVYEEGEEEVAWQDLARSCPVLGVLLPLRRSGPMAGRRLVARILAGEDDLLPQLAELLEGAGSPRAAAVRRLVGPTPTPVPGKPAALTGDAELEEARAKEATRPCPGCGAVKGRRVLRVQKEGPNQGRLFVKCFGCQHFDWLDGVKPGSVARDDPELARLQSDPPLCWADCGRVEVGRVRKPGRNQGRLYTRCPACGAFCWR
jgi:hypothetical protein